MKKYRIDYYGKIEKNGEKCGFSYSEIVTEKELSEIIKGYEKSYFLSLPYDYDNLYEPLKPIFHNDICVSFIFVFEV